MKEIPKSIFNDYIYNPETGDLRRTTRANSNGSIDKAGYLIIKYKGSQYKSHRVCWYLFYGKEPLKTIDHINGIKTDNRISNLRDVTISENNMNIDRSNVKGYYKDKTTKGLKKVFTVNDRGKPLRFYTEQDAIECRKEIDLKNKYLIRGTYEKEVISDTIWIKKSKITV